MQKENGQAEATEVVRKGDEGKGGGGGGSDDGGIMVLPLGAGQDVGRSCIIVEMNGRTIMFDCGMHMGYNDSRRFPDFSVLTDGDLTSRIDVVIVSHFHLDHCGALPFFSEMCGYEKPIYMTYPTRAICPLLLEDYRKISVERKGERNFFTSQMIKDCMSKVRAVDLHQSVTIADDIEIKAYYAGHVLGAAMFHVRVGDKSVVYTGDYNMTPDRHLGTAWIDFCKPDAIITESTYATTIRDSKRCRERDFLTKVHRCVKNGGKVLIPVFALGRAQELCILLETYWERYKLDVPIFFSTGLTERANEYYRLFVMYTNQKIKDTFVHRNLFDFKHIRAFDRSFADQPGPQVLFATPGMLHAGVALEVFAKWAGSPKNMVRGERQRGGGGERWGGGEVERDRRWGGGDRQTDRQSARTRVCGCGWVCVGLCVCACVCVGVGAVSFTCAAAWRTAVDVVLLALQVILPGYCVEGTVGAQVLLGDAVM